MDLAKAVRDRWVWGQLALIVVVGAGIPVAARNRWPLSTPGPLPVRLPGLLLLALGVGLSLWGARSLGPSLTPGTEPLATGRLIETGAYRIVRHPIYLGVVLLLAGWAWWQANAWLGLLSGLVGFWYFRQKASVEEQWLASRFPAYADYRSRVPKLIPNLW